MGKFRSISHKLKDSFPFEREERLGWREESYMAIVMKCEDLELTTRRLKLRFGGRSEELSILGMNLLNPFPLDQFRVCKTTKSKNLESVGV